MSLPYFLRLLCLCFASFFVLQAALGVARTFAAPAAIRLAERTRPRFAARLLFAVGMFPVALSALVVLGLCVPSYLWLEPQATSEQVGIACIGLAVLGAATWAVAMTRVFYAMVRSSRYVRRCRRAGWEVCLPGETSTALVVEDEAPLLSLAGVVHPRLVVSRRVMRALSAEQFEAALRHERAHRSSRDNLKRLLLLLAPGVFPFSQGFAPLEASWARFTEWAADDQAAGGDGRRALSLATALVRFARMGATPPLPTLTASLLAGDRDLSARVDRLLRTAPPHEEPHRQMRALAVRAGVLLAVCLVAVMLLPASLHAVHQLLEHVIR